MRVSACFIALFAVGVAHCNSQSIDVSSRPSDTHALEVRVRPSDWYSPMDIHMLEDELHLGDILEFRRVAGYSHWGIYVGQYQGMCHAVIHFGMFEGAAAFVKKKISGSVFAAKQKPEIRADPIEKILECSSKVRINNFRDKEVQPLDPEDIIATAKRMHQDQTEINYSFISNNCKHFVNRCRYKHSHSDLVIDVLEASCNIFVVATSEAAQVLTKLQGLWQGKDLPEEVYISWMNFIRAPIPVCQLDHGTAEPSRHGAGQPLPVPLEHVRRRHQLLERLGRYKMPNKQGKTRVDNPKLCRIVDCTDERCDEEAARISPEEFQMFCRCLEEGARRDEDGETEGEN